MNSSFSTHTSSYMSFEVSKLILENNLNSLAVVSVILSSCKQRTSKNSRGRNPLISDGRTESRQYAAFTLFLLYSAWRIETFEH